MKLTRYMDFAKYVSMLNDGIFMPSPHLFKDKWEGLLPFYQASSSGFQGLKESYLEWSRWAYVSSWYSGESEDYAMWKLFGKNSESVAIQTTKDKLESAFKFSHENVFACCDKVRYFNPEDDFSYPLDINIISSIPGSYKGDEVFPFFWCLYLKHRAFIAESEVRLVALDKNYDQHGTNREKGIIIDFRRVPDFIEKVTLAPFCADWFRAAVESVSLKYGINCNIVVSDIEQLLHFN